MIRRANPGNVKTVIKDKDGLYLVGISSYPNPNITYSLLGGHTEKGETPFETLGREMLEESSLVLELNYDEKKGFSIKDPFHQMIYLNFDGISVECPQNTNRSKAPQWFIFFNVNTSLTPYMISWKTKFLKNQNQIKNDAIQSLKEVDSNLKWEVIIDLFLKRKFQDMKQELSTRLTKAESEQVISYMKEIAYYLENKDLALADKEDLKNKLYEKDVLKYL